MAGSYLKSLQLAKQLEQKAKEASKRKSDTETRLKDAESILERCKSLNAEVVDIEKAITEANAAFESKDFDTALDRAERAVETAKKIFAERIQSILTGADDIIVMIRDLGEEPEQLKKLVNETKSSLEKGDLDGTIKLAEQTWDASQKALHEQYSKAYSRAQQLLLKAKDLGESVDDLQDKLRDTKQKIESEDPTSAINTVRSILGSASDILKSRIASDIDTIEDSVLSTEDMGVDVNRLKEYVSRARELLEEREFDEAMSYARRAQNESNKASSGRVHEEMRRIREAVRTTKKHGGEVDAVTDLIDATTKALKEKDISDASGNIEKAQKTLKDIQFKLVLKQIAKAKDSFVLAKKLNIDISRPISQLNESRERLQKGQFEEAMDAAENAEKEIEMSLSAFKDARECTEKLASMIKQIEEIGIELPSDFAFFEEARDALAKRDFVVASDKSGAGVNELDKLIRRLAEETVLDADGLVSLGVRLGVNINAAKEYMESANDHLTELNPIEAYSEALKSIESSKAACHEYMNDTLSFIEAFVDECSKSFDVEEYVSALENAKALVESEDFFAAVEKIEAIKTGLETKGSEECKRLIGEAEVKLGELEAAGIDAADLHLMITKADEAYKKAQYETAVATAREAIDDANEALEDVAQKSMFTFKAALENAKAESIDTAKWRSLYKQAKEMLDSGDNSSSYQISRKSVEEINRFVKEKQVLIGNLEECDELLKEATKNKIDVAKHAESIKSAKAALESLDIEKATSLIDGAHSALERSMAMHLAAKMIFTLKSGVEFAEREDISAGSSKQSLDRAKTLMKERKYEEALAAAKATRTELNSVFEKRINEDITEVRSLIADAKNVGVDTARPEKLIEKAENELDTGNLETGVKSAMLARNEIDQIREFSSKSAMEIRIARERIRDAEVIGFDMTGPRTDLEQAVDSLNNHKYAIAYELAAKISARVLEMIKDNLDVLFEKLSSRIEKSEKEGAAIERVQALLDDAKRKYDGMAFQESIKFMMQCEHELDRADLQREIAQKSLDVAKKRLEDAERDLMIVTRAKKIYEDASKAMKKKKFADVIELSISLGDEIERVSHGADDSRQDLNALGERLMRLSRIGVDIHSVEEHHKKADDAFHNADFEACREICIEAEGAMTVELEKSIKERLSKANELIGTAGQLGMKTNEFNDMLAVAQTSVNEGLWDFAYEQVQKVISTIEEDVKERLYSSMTDIRSKMSVIAKTGAAIKPIEDRLLDTEKRIEAGEFTQAFDIIAETESLMSKTESVHRDYLDIKYAAESAISIAKKFGIPSKDCSDMISEAESLRNSDYSAAVELLRKATEKAKANLDKFNPDIEVTLRSADLKQDEDGAITIEIRNKGRALAKDLKLEFFGSNMKAESLPELPQMKANESKTVKIPVVPGQSGELDISITIIAKRVFDGESFEFHAKSPVIVLPKEPTVRVARATEAAKCTACNGMIKPGFDIAICNKCQAIEHLACAKRTKKCGSCGAAFEF